MSEARRIPWRTLLDVPLVVRCFHVEPSHFDAGVFAVVDATRLDTGESVAVTCGARYVLEELRRLRRHGELKRHPVWLVEIDHGRRPFLWLECDLAVTVVVRWRPNHVTIFTFAEAA